MTFPPDAGTRTTGWWRWRLRVHMMCSTSINACQTNETLRIRYLVMGSAFLTSLVFSRILWAGLSQIWKTTAHRPFSCLFSIFASTLLMARARAEDSDAEDFWQEYRGWGLFPLSYFYWSFTSTSSRVKKPFDKGVQTPTDYSHELVTSYLLSLPLECRS